MGDASDIVADLEQLNVSDSYSCSPEHCNTYLKITKAGINIFHVNIRSIGNISNFNNLLILLERTKVHFHVIVLSECWLQKCPYLPTIPGFESYTSDHSNKNEGVVVYIRSGMKFTVEKPVFDDANCLIIKFSTELALIAIYRSPSFRNIQNFITSLDTTLHSLNSFKSIVLMGDININIAPNNNDMHSHLYLDTLASHGMLPAHSFATRCDSCLDHAIIKSKTSVTTLVLDSFITDHAPVIVSFNSRTKTPKSVILTRRVDIAACAEELEKIDFSSVLQSRDASQAADDLVNIISNIVNNNTCNNRIPSKKRILKPWITPGILKCIRNRDKLYRKTKIEPSNEISLVIYLRYKKFCNRLLKKIKRDYERAEFKKHSKNPKATWKLIKTIASLHTNKSSAHELLSLTDDPASAVDVVNDFFVNVGSNLASKIDNSHNDAACVVGSHSISAYPNSMAIFETDNEEIEKVILNLNSASAVGCDGISTVLVKSARHILIPIMCHIFNLVFTTGVFPSVFKTGLVHPIYKGGTRDRVDNYRPISVLTTLSKILEKIINNRLLSYLQAQNIIAENQYGFRSGRSTEDAVLELTNTIAKNLNNKLKTLAIFLDLSKAFDTVSVPLLLNKLERLGIRGLPLSIFTSYLTGRSQSTRIGNCTSRPKCISYGVPQGSVLGPTLFLIYINDLCNLPLVNAKIITYADDTAILVHGNEWSDTQLHAESALQTTMTWLRKNLLTLNLVKTKFMTFSPRTASQPNSAYTLTAHICNPSTNQKCNCAQVARTNCMKYLGIHVDSTLSWNEHINSLVGRVRKLIYVFKNLRASADFPTLKTVYYALAHSILTYCITAWGNSGKTLLLRVERAQRAILKVMSRKPIHFPTNELYALCEVPRVRHAFVLGTVLRKHSELPYRADPVEHRRRSIPVCRIESVRIELVRRQYTYLSSILYNRVNRVCHIYSLNRRECRVSVDKWLHGLTYEELENLVKT